MSIFLLLGAQGMLFLSREFTAWIWVPAITLSMLSPFVRMPDSRLISRLFLAAFILPAPILGLFAWHTRNYLFFAILYAVILSVLKVFQLRRANDFLQLYALVLLLIIAAAVVNPGPGFGLLFVPVALLLPLCLIANNLRRGVEKAFIPEHRHSVLARRDIFSKKFVLIAITISLAAFLGALIVFIALPRFDPGFFNPNILNGISVSGFSDDVDLNERNPIIQDKSVVMRVQAIKGELHPPIRLRGLSFATYMFGKWHKLFRLIRPVRMDEKGRYKITAPGRKAPFKDQVIMDITSKVWGKKNRPILGMPDMTALEIRFDIRYKNFRFFLKEDGLGSVIIQGTGHRQIMYRTYSRFQTNDPGKLRKTGTSYPQIIKEYFLQHPKRLSPRIMKLARDITRGKQTPYDQAIAIRTFLRKNIRYSLSPPQGKSAPLVDFLFNKKAGPCEFYATAMVMMLRSIDIPSMLITGFYGGTMTKNGDFIEIHASDAHAWVEVYFPGQGFITMDPTPPSVIKKRNQNNGLSGFESLITSMKLWWYRWVVKYNLKKQAALFLQMLTGDKRINNDPYSMAIRFKKIMRNIRRSAPAIARNVGIGIIIFLSLIGLGIFLPVLRRNRHSRTYFHSAERMLALRGIVRQPGQTPKEMSELVKDRLPAAYPAFQRLVDIYYQDLFGPDLNNSQHRNISVLLKEIKSAVKV